MDPGLAETGWAVVEDQGGRLVLVASGVIRTYPAWGLVRRLGRIHGDLVAAAREHSISRVRVEAYVSHGTRVGSSVLDAGVGTGEVIACAVLAGLAAGAAVDEPIRAAEWQAAIGRPRAGSLRDREARKRLSAAVVRAQVAGIPAGAPDHVTDAAGIAASAWVGARQQTALELGGYRGAPRRRARGT